jgi:hypothetical protein
MSTEITYFLAAGDGGRRRRRTNSLELDLLFFA